MSLPPPGILTPVESTATAAVVDTDAVRDVLTRVGVSVVDVAASIAPQIVSYAVELDRGADPKKVERAADSLALALGTPVRYAGVEAGRVIIEANRLERAAVPLADLWRPSESFSPSTVIGGVDTADRRVLFSLAALPHLLVAGTTGSGKSTFIVSLLTALMLQATPEQVRFVLIDPKRVELSAFEDSPHLLEPVVQDVGGAVASLRRAAAMMDARYEAMQGEAKDVTAYNALHKDKPMPRVVVVVDELADLIMQGKKVVEDLIVRIAQLGRAAGIHLILATQRPDAKTFTGLIRSNVPARVAFAVQSHTDSGIILGSSGAEKLGGGGDGLYKGPKSLGVARRFQSAFVSTDDARRVVAWWRRERPAVVKAAPEPERDDTGAEQARLRAELDALLPAASKGDGVTSGATPAEVLDACGITPEVVDALAESLSERIGAGVLDYINRTMGEQR